MMRQYAWSDTKHHEQIPAARHPGRYGERWIDWLLSRETGSLLMSVDSDDSEILQLVKDGNS